MNSITTFPAYAPVPARSIAAPNREVALKRFEFYFSTLLLDEIPALSESQDFLYYPAAPLDQFNVLEREAAKGDESALLDLALYWQAVGNLIKSQEYVEQIKAEGMRLEVIFLRLINQKLLSTADIEWLDRSDSPYAKLLLARLKGQGELLPLDLKGAFELAAHAKGTNLHHELFEIDLLLQLFHFLKHGTEEQKQEAREVVFQRPSVSMYKSAELQVFYDWESKRFTDQGVSQSVLEATTLCSLLFNVPLVSIGKKLSCSNVPSLSSYYLYLENRHIPSSAFSMGELMESNNTKFASVRHFRDAFRLGHLTAAFKIAKLSKEPIIARAWGLITMKLVDPRMAVYLGLDPSKIMSRGDSIFTIEEPFHPFDPANENDCVAKLFSEELYIPMYNTGAIKKIGVKSSCSPAPFKDPAKKEKSILFFQQMFSKEEKEGHELSKEMFGGFPASLIDLRQSLFERDLSQLIAKWRNLAFTKLNSPASISNEEIKGIISGLNEEKAALKLKYRKYVDELNQTVIQQTQERLYLFQSAFLLNKAIPLRPDLIYTQPLALRDNEQPAHKNFFLRYLKVQILGDFFRIFDFLYIANTWAAFSPSRDGVPQAQEGEIMMIVHCFRQICNDPQRNCRTSLLTLLSININGEIFSRVINPLEHKKVIDRFEGLVSHPEFGPSFSLSLAIFHIVNKSPCAKPKSSLVFLETFLKNLDDPFSQKALLCIYYAIFNCFHAKSYSPEEVAAFTSAFAPIENKLFEICQKAHENKDLLGSHCLALYYYHNQKACEINRAPASDLQIAALEKFAAMSLELCGYDQQSEMKVLHCINILLWQKKYKEAHDYMCDAHKKGCLFKVYPLIGLFYETGLGAAKDEARALKLYQEGANNNVISAWALLGRKKEKGRVAFYQKHQVTNCHLVNLYLEAFNLPLIDPETNFKPENPSSPTQDTFIDGLKDEIGRTHSPAFNGEQQKEYAELIKAATENAVKGLESALKDAAPASWEERKTKAKSSWDEERTAIIQAIRKKALTQETKKKLLDQANSLKERCTVQLSKMSEIDQRVALIVQKIERESDLLIKEGEIKKSLESVESMLPVSQEDRIKQLEAQLYGANRQIKQLEQERGRERAEFADYVNTNNLVVENLGAQIASQPQEDVPRSLFEELAVLLQPAAAKLLWELNVPTPKKVHVINLLEAVGFTETNTVGSHHNYKASCPKGDFFCTVWSHKVEVTMMEKKDCLNTILDYLT